jgi:hypothetical protein
LLGDRLLALTFALEDAVVRHDWPEVTALFGERGRLLDSAPNLGAANTKSILEADAKLQRRLETEKSHVLAKLKQTRKVSAARKLYSKFR